jgi:hypothetical protein
VTSCHSFGSPEGRDGEQRLGVKLEDNFLYVFSALGSKNDKEIFAFFPKTEKIYRPLPFLGQFNCPF